MIKKSSTSYDYMWCYIKPATFLIFVKIQNPPQFWLSSIQFVFWPERKCWSQNSALALTCVVFVSWLSRLKMHNTPLHPRTEMKINKLMFWFLEEEKSQCLEWTCMIILFIPQLYYYLLTYLSDLLQHLQWIVKLECHLHT